MTLQPVRIAVIGAGVIGPRHARAVVAEPETELTAIVDPQAVGYNLADELKTRHYESIEKLLAAVALEEVKVDAAVICTPNYTHVDVAKELARAGVHMLVEKPLCTELAHGRELLQYLASKSSKVLVGHHRRFNPYAVATKSVISPSHGTSQLGKIVAVNGLWVLHKPTEYFEPPVAWHQMRKLGGGVLLINMIHEIDLLHNLLGPISRVYGEPIIPQRDHEVEEGAAITIRFWSGVVGTFLVADCLPSPFNFESGTGENPSLAESGSDFYRIFGTEACLSVPDMTIWSHREPKSWSSPFSCEKIAVKGDSDPLAVQLQHFVRVVRGTETACCTPQAGFAALVVCEAIRQAIVSGVAVNIEKYDL